MRIINNSYDKEMKIDQQRKKSVSQVMKCITFLAILVFMINFVGAIFAHPHATFWAEETGLDAIHTQGELFDICFVGTSIVVVNISNQVIYEEKGIAGLSFGEPIQPMFLTRATVEEIFRYQKPAVIVADSRSLFYSESMIGTNITTMEEEIVHFALDSIFSPDIRYHAIKLIKEQYNEKIRFVDYFCDLLAYHNNWKNLDWSHFTGKGSCVCLNGNIMFTTIKDDPGKGVDTSDSINEQNITELAKMKEICENHGARLILMTGYIEEDESRQKAISEVARRLKLDYIDVNSVLDEIGFDREHYVYDYIHFNIAGARNWSSWIGEYLEKEYNMPDHRGDDKYQVYEDQRSLLQEYEENMKEMLKDTDIEQL